jgi:cbb3-type cytochrome oxidase subunit 1
MRLSDICLASAVAAAILGMMLGLAMGASEDFTLAPAHAHLNLLGWVTMALMGLYYRGSPATHWPAARIQVALALAGFWSMPVGLAVMLATGDGRAVIAVMAGSLCALAAMVLFAAIVLAEMRARAVRPHHPVAESG